MILQAGYDCYLTQAEDMPLSERRFENQVLINSPEDVAMWKEITSQQKEQMIAEASFIDVAAINVEALDRVDTLLNDISANINNAGLTTEEALSKKDYFPAWEDLIGTEVDCSSASAMAARSMRLYRNIHRRRTGSRERVRNPYTRLCR
jgi:hypothetical protein